MGGDCSELHWMDWMIGQDSLFVGRVVAATVKDRLLFVRVGEGNDLASRF